MDFVPGGLHERRHGLACFRLVSSQQLAGSLDYQDRVFWYQKSSLELHAGALQ